MKTEMEGLKEEMAEMQEELAELQAWKRSVLQKTQPAHAQQGRGSTSAV